MASALHLKFDPNQDYQLDAIQSANALFDGLPRRAVEFGLAGEIVPNLPPDERLDEEWLRDNLAAVQRRNGLDASSRLAMDEGLVLDGAGFESWRYPRYTIEMETGTGKTYVYLRTIYELRRQYGFGKFIIVVPSIAIFEGVVTSFKRMESHFRALYGNEPVGLTAYDGSQLSRLRTFASSTLCEVLVITLDAFNKGSNVLYRASEKLPGERKPYQYIQETQPILILDEPQNMESERSREALRTLHPLFALAYSATPRTRANLIYRLTPFEAYRRGLVKRIQVYGVTERDNLNQTLLALEEVTLAGGITARIRTVVNEDGVAREGEVILRQGDNLHTKTGRDEHRAGYIVREIHAGDQRVTFENGVTLTRAASAGAGKEEIFRQQIEATIDQHLEMQNRLEGQGIKVLSLFFIDRVANYVSEDALIRRLFDEAFEKLKRRSARFAHRRPDEVRHAYFAERKLPSGDTVAIDISDDIKASERQAAKDAFELIMRRKEDLLSFTQPVSFIFAHSALREGWDNPNVFQICTLNQAVSETRKRQEIGRGLRLCVNQDGDRVLDDEVNVLTVVANESYGAYADALQREYAEVGETPPPRPTNARTAMARRNDRIFLGDADFRRFWDQLSRRLRYRIVLNTPTLVQRCVERLNAAQFPRPMLVVEKGRFAALTYTLTLKSIHHTSAMLVVARSAWADDPAEEQSKIVKPGDRLARVFRDERLRDITVLDVIDGAEPCITFAGMDLRLTRDAPYSVDIIASQRGRESARYEPDETFPVFNLIDRTARETGLTRPTVNAIFRGLTPANKQKLLHNPEGFAGVFISIIRNTLADHIATRIEFTVDENAQPVDLDGLLEQLFPPEKRFPQRELVESGDHGLYDMAQKDSENEALFVDRLRRDQRVVFYFKFPPAFKVRLPRIIGNYNPDWGIGRRDESGQLTLHLVRETKGSEDLTTLQFPHEQRKIRCAQRHFEALGIDYRHVTGKTLDWYKSAQQVGEQLQLEGE